MHELSRPTHPTCWNGPPPPQTAVLAVRDGWLHVLNDWLGALQSGSGAWRAGWQRQFAQLQNWPIHRAFRTHIELEGLVFGLAVHPSPLRLAIGSANMALERALLHAGLSSGPNAAASMQGLEVLLALWDSADPHAAPLAVEWHSGRSLSSLPLPAHDWQRLEPALQRRAARLDGLAQHAPVSAQELAAQHALALLEAAPTARNALLRLVAALPALQAEPTGVPLQQLACAALKTAAADPVLAGASQTALHSVAALALALPPRWLATLMVRLTEPVARQFLAGADVPDAGPVLQALERSGLDATIDRLGEAVVTEAEADRYVADVTAIIDAVAARHPPGARNLAGQLRAHVSIKCSALCPHYDADNPEGVWRSAGPRLLLLLERAEQLQVCVQLDAEHRPVRDLTLWLLQRALRELQPATSAPPLEVGIVVQAYLTDAESHLREVVALAQTRQTPLSIRLVKGAYWDAETMQAAAHGRLPEQFLCKSETDLQFQHLLVQLIAASATGLPVRVAVASHNLRDHAFACEVRNTLFPHAPALEHQVLHQTANPLAFALQADGHAVRVYVPVGSLLMGMAYLVRRILENSSQVGVLTQTRQGLPLASRLIAPAHELLILRDQQALPRAAVLPELINTPPLQLHHPDAVQALQAAIANRPVLKLQPGGHTGPLQTVLSPCDHKMVVGTIRTAASTDLEPLLLRAAQAQPHWGALTALQRAQTLWQAAILTRANRLELAALICAEAGKPRLEALADVDEAADFLHYYANLAVSSGTSAKTEPLGVVAVIAPWNFPLAIAVGMAAAALAAGNAVVLKSAEATPLVVERWLGLCCAEQLWGDTLLHAVGGAETGAALAAHPLVSGISFTGSLRVGQQLAELIARAPAPDGWPRRLVAELGGKNAVVVCASADLDEAVLVLLRSAFGHAGQKCSAASRAIVDASIYPQLLARLVDAAHTLQVGPGWSAASQLGPVIRASDQQRLRDAARACWQEWLAHGGSSDAPCCDKSHLDDAALPPGWYVGPIVLPAKASQALDRNSTLHREQFGPLLQVIEVHSEAEAIAVCNATSYALTAGVVSQDPNQVERLVSQLRAGNVYVNRPITGARVGVEPFGGFGRSGSGPKAGGPQALWPWRRPILRPAPASWLDLPQPGAASPRAWPTVDWPLLASSLRAAAVRADAVQYAAAQTLADLRWLATSLPRQLGPQRRADRLTVALPAQRTHLLWLRPRGPVAVLAAAHRDADVGLLYAAAALLCGCPVVVLAQHEAANQRWTQWLHWLDLTQPDAICLLGPCDREAQAAVLDDPQLAVIAVDSSSAPPCEVQRRALLPRLNAPTARQFVSPATTVLGRDTGHWLQCFALPTVVAENTLRHGAPLQDDATA